VALLEAERTGGDCLYTGCVPSKSLIATARTIRTIQTAAAHGISVPEVTFSLGRAIDRKQGIIAAIAPHDSPELLNSAGVEVIHGVARFVSPHRIEIGKRLIEAAKIVIATGSEPSIPDIPGLAEAGYVTSAELMERREPPRRLVVIGSGPVGLELGQAFSRFGGTVTILGRNARLLSRDEIASTVVLKQALLREGLDVQLEATVEQITRRDNDKVLRVRTGTGDVKVIEADEIFVATGRVPRMRGFGLEHAGVEVVNGAIQVDKRLRTSVSHIWACGDVIGAPYWTHAAEDQGRTVAANVLGGRKRWSARAIPWATYTDPEVAGVGLTVEQARAHYGDRIAVLQLPYSAIDRALTDSVDDGLLTVILKRGWTRGRLGGEIAGAHIVGARAGDLINQFAFMMTWRLPAGMLARSVQTYPSLSLGVRQVVGRHWQ
jgi:pyruvate/2-oxoglutarate dehydrogenase complex dihydrolipoamide dehydrogenase (E3) component